MVGIIPKPTKKIPRWHNLALYISLGLLLAVVLSYVILFYLGNKSLSNLWDLEDRIMQAGAIEEKLLEVKVISDKKRINDFSEIFQDHKKSSNFFKFLEEICHPQIWLTELTLSPDDAQASISGKTSSFQALGQQFLIFQKQNLIQEISLTDLSLGKEGKIEFRFSILFDPQIFK